MKLHGVLECKHFSENPATYLGAPESAEDALTVLSLATHPHPDGCWRKGSNTPAPASAENVLAAQSLHFPAPAFAYVPDLHFLHASPTSYSPEPHALTFGLGLGVGVNDRFWVRVRLELGSRLEIRVELGFG